MRCRSRIQHLRPFDAEGPARKSCRGFRRSARGTCTGVCTTLFVAAAGLLEIVGCGGGGGGGSRGAAGEGRVEVRIEGPGVVEAAGKELLFEVRLIPPGPAAEVEYRIEEGTAAAGEDFTGSGGVVSFQAGEALQRIAVPLEDDPRDEDDETFEVVLTKAAGARISRDRAVGTIIDDDPEPTLSASGSSLSETDAGGPLRAFVLELSAPSGREVRATYATRDGSAKAGRDYVPASGEVAFAPGETEKGIEVTVIGDDLPEEEETFTLRLSAAVHAQIRPGEAKAIITDVEDQASGLDARPSNGDCVLLRRPRRAGTQLAPAFRRLWATPHLAEVIGIHQAPGDGSRWYALDRRGVIRSFEDDDDVRESEVFLDIQDRVLMLGEGGLLSVVFHPRFDRNGLVFIFYTAPSAPLVSRISRFESRDGGKTLSRSSEETIFQVEQVNRFHKGGYLAFGPDGFLYAGLGDDTKSASAQDLNSFRGKLIRIDVDSRSPYAIPPDNPFASGGGRPEIYAWGFRNPWRWSFDRLTGELWLCDVGEKAREEIDRVERGKNYGWPIREGTACHSGDCSRTDIVDPVHEWSQEEGARAGIGGFVYRGSALTGLEGAYIFGDWGSGKIWALTEESGGRMEARLLAEVESGAVIFSFAEDEEGEIYVMTAGRRIFRLAPSDSGSGESLPSKLSDLACVDASDPSTPAPGLIPYDINVPFWSDGAVKERWLAIPDGKKIEIEKDGDWDLPVGSVLLKTFRLDGKLVETRVLARHEDGDWAGYSYEWNDGGTDAVLLSSGKTKSVGRGSWRFPSRGECLQCHTDAAGGTLGLETAQLNRSFRYAATGRTRNQLTTFQAIGLLASALPDDPDDLPAFPRLDDPGAPLEERARAYLHANCSHCHRPGGSTRGVGDYRFQTRLGDTGLCNREPPDPDPQFPDAVLISPGDPSKSLILLRMEAGDSRHMPPIGVRAVDEQGTDLLESWIRGMRGCP